LGWVHFYYWLCEQICQVLVEIKNYEITTPFFHYKSCNHYPLIFALIYNSHILSCGEQPYMPNFSEKVNFIWSVAELLRDAFTRSKYQDVILPFTVLRRLDCVLEPTKQAVLETNAKFKGKIENLHPQLCAKSGFAFYNTSPFNFERLLEDPHNLASNLMQYINGFSENMREVLEKFSFPATISKANEKNILFLIVEKFKNVDLHPSQVSNFEMGTIFEELIRRFNEALNENPGEHFTPREVIHLMADLLLTTDQDMLAKNHIVRTVYDPACGSGGMLTIAKSRIKEINPNAEIYLFGQEVNDETYAVAKSDLYMTSADGEDAERIKCDSTLGNDLHRDRKFDYMLANPPYGKEWKPDEGKVRTEAEKGYAGRFGAGLPAISDGQILFLQTMLWHMQPLENGGSRIAIVMNGSPLFTGDAGSGESEIRRWILENDWLETIVALPEQIFYNTGIATYIWILSNRKLENRKSKVQLISAVDLWEPMRKSLGKKRRFISETQIKQVVQLYSNFKETETSKLFAYTDFGYRKVTVDRPLKLNLRASPERISLLKNQSQFQALAVSKKKEEKAKAQEELDGRKLQDHILAALAGFPPTLFTSRSEFEEVLAEIFKKNQITLSAPLRKAILTALSERDENAEVCCDKDGNPEYDSELRDTENVPLREGIQSYFEREVLPHVPDAWINKVIIDHKDHQVGKVGYEINFNRYFYKYIPPRPLKEIESDIKKLEYEIQSLRGDLSDG
jgi:type I restriction enzyme M protein